MADTVNQAESTVIGLPNKPVDTVNVVSIDPKMPA